ncbi:DUF421 domain-containing protein [Bacillus songklensis]|uniref:DUF421 domain-containing protein n=1 Tax=Bacillus songklensis TaxID=1069116 RepID=A0ABV8B2D5_9BACI
MMDFVRIGVELFVGFISLFLLTKLLGKMTITQITTFDFISALVLGELVGNALYDHKTGLTDILFAVVFWGVLMFGTEILTQKNLRVRSLLEGRPAIIIHKGRIRYKEMKKNHLDISQLQHLLRAKDAFSIREVEYAILETDGTVSVLKKSDYASPTKADHKMPNKQPVLPITFISDGQLLKENLKESGFDETWLQKELHKKGIRNYSQVMYAEWEDGDSLHVEKY